MTQRKTIGRSGSRVPPADPRIRTLTTRVQRSLQEEDEEEDREYAGARVVRLSSGRRAPAARRSDPDPQPPGVYYARWKVWTIAGVVAWIFFRFGTGG